MNFLQKRAILKKANYLELTPIRIIAEETDENQMVSLLMPRFINRLSKILVEPLLRTPYIKLKLDHLGSAAWLAIDGKKTVQIIADDLTLQFSSETQMYARLTKFFTLLYSQKMITFNEIARK